MHTVSLLANSERDASGQMLWGGGKLALDGPALGGSRAFQARAPRGVQRGRGRLFDKINETGKDLGLIF